MLEIANYMDDFLAYYNRAETLNLRNMGKSDGDLSGCPLQDQIPIYDTIYRRWAGFSKVLEDLWKGPEPNKPHAGKKRSTKAFKGHFSIEEWLYIFLVHRCTGSGASFELDHGYRNSIVIPMAESAFNMHSEGNVAEFKLNYMANYLKNHRGPIFTSIGNQPPPFNKPAPPYTQAGRYYLCEAGVQFVKDLSNWILPGPTKPKKPKSIRETMNWVLDWHTTRGMKRYVFVMTAFVMDIAEYFPDFVDPKSHVYLGANAQKAMDLIFINSDPKLKRADWLDEGMEYLIAATGNDEPMSIEDVLCDFIRYKDNYVPPCYKAQNLDPLRLVLVMDQERQKSKADMMPTFSRKKVERKMKFDEYLERKKNGLLKPRVGRPKSRSRTTK
jgi:hypothetical protein